MLKRLFIGAAVAAVAAVFVRSVPDVKRYIKMKRM